MKKLAFLLAACCTAALAQDQPQDAPPAVTEPAARDNTLTSLAGQFFGGDFFNIYGFVNGVFDTTEQTLKAGETNNRGSDGGIDVGGGVALSHVFSTAFVSLNYRGDYRDYQGYFGSGTNQYLSFAYSKRLSRRWSLSIQETGGILLYGNNFYSSSTGEAGGVQTNPFSETSRFTSSSVYLSYQQSRRLFYTVGGSLFLSRYGYPGAIGSTGVAFTGSATYQLTPLTNFGGTYTHDNFYFQRNVGQSNIDGVYGNASHRFGRGLSAHISAGVTRVNSAGTIDVPVQIILPGGQDLTGYEIGHYNTTRSVPTINGGVSKSFHRYSFSVSAGRGVTPGNGTILTSTSTYFGGVASRSWRNNNFSAGASYSHTDSISNSVSQTYSQANFSVSYSRNLIRHLSFTSNYSYFHYGGFLGYNGVSDNRLTFGLAFAKKNIPLTLY